MSNKILFGTEPNVLKYSVSGIRDLSISINNKFFNQSIVDDNSNTFLHDSSNIIVDCLAATSKDIAILQSAAIGVMPIYCQISSDKVYNLFGCFVISYLSLNNSEDEIPQCSFTLKSSGHYEIR